MRYLLRPGHLLRAFSIIGLLTVVPGGNAWADTSVALTFHGPLGESVSITSAQLLVSAWGVSEQYDLPVQGNIVRLDLEKTRPEFADRFADEKGYLYIKTDGYAPLISQGFTWPAPGQTTVIDFRNLRRVTIALGTAARLDVTLRRPVSRQIRLVDGANRPVAGAEVQSAAHWDTPNHCGFLNGMDVVAKGVTNAAGGLEVPDIDGNHAFILLSTRMVFADADSTFPAGGRHGLVTSLTRVATTLRVRRYQRRRLVLDVVSNKRPVAGAILWGDMGLGVCGAGYGALATADSLGRIRIDDFYPEMWTSFWVCADRKQVWVLPDNGQLPPRVDVGVTPSAEQNGFADLCGR
jgi:hypothetical protein